MSLTKYGNRGTFVARPITVEAFKQRDMYDHGDARAFLDCNHLEGNYIDSNGNVYRYWDRAGNLYPGAWAIKDGHSVYVLSDVEFRRKFKKGDK